MLVKLSQFIVLVFFLLVSEQVLAHANHSFYEQDDATFEQSFFDDETDIEQPLLKYRQFKQFYSLNVQFQKTLIFQNLDLFQLVLKYDVEKKQIEDDCNCLNNCSCLDCQCANCPMGTGCHSSSAALLHNIIAVIQPFHNQSTFAVYSDFISQPHTLLFRPPIPA